MTQVAVIEQRSPSLVSRVAERYGVEPAKMLDTLKATCFKADKPVSNEQMMALLIVAEQYHLNPFTKEIYAFPDKGGIVPVVGLDGWARIINEHPQFDGVDFEMKDDASAITAVIFRKDRQYPIRVTEYMAECKRNTGPWNTHPRRMLRHKALIQAARLAFGFAGIYDEDEAHRIAEGDVRTEPPSAGAARVRAVLAGGTPTEVTDISGAVEVADVASPPASSLPVSDGVIERFDHWANRIVRAEDIELAGLVLDEARSEFPDDQYEGLVAAYRAKWQTETKDE